MFSAVMAQQYLKGLNGYSCLVLLFYHFNELCDDLISHIVDVPSALRISEKRCHKANSYSQQGNKLREDGSGKHFIKTMLSVQGYQEKNKEPCNISVHPTIRNL